MKKLFAPGAWEPVALFVFRDFCLTFVCTKPSTIADGHRQTYRHPVQQAEGWIVPRLHPRLLQREGEAHPHIGGVPTG